MHSSSIVVSQKMTAAEMVSAACVLPCASKWTSNYGADQHCLHVVDLPTSAVKRHSFLSLQQLYLTTCPIGRFSRRSSLSLNARQGPPSQEQEASRACSVADDSKSDRNLGIEGDMVEGTEQAGVVESGRKSSRTRKTKKTVPKKSLADFKNEEELLAFLNEVGLSNYKDADKVAASKLWQDGKGFTTLEQLANCDYQILEDTVGWFFAGFIQHAATARLRTGR
jgi:hypothetical protein